MPGICFLVVKLNGLFCNQDVFPVCQSQCLFGLLFSPTLFTLFSILLESGHQYSRVCNSTSSTCLTETHDVQRKCVLLGQCGNFKYVNRMHSAHGISNACIADAASPISDNADLAIPNDNMISSDGMQTFPARDLFHVYVGWVAAHLQHGQSQLILIRSTKNSISTASMTHTNLILRSRSKLSYL